MNGKTVQLAKDIERELKDGDQIGLLPSTFFFRVSFSTDVNNNKDNHDSDSDADSVYGCKKEEPSSPVRAASPDQWSPTPGYRRSTSTQDTSVFDFDDDIQIESTSTPAPAKRISFEKKTSADVEPKPPIPKPASPVAINRMSVSSPSVVDEVKFFLLKISFSLLIHFLG